MMTGTPEWQFWFYDMPFNEIPNEKAYYLLVQTMDPKPNDVSNGVSFTISESGSVLTRKIVGGTTDIEWPHPAVPMRRGRTQRSFGAMPIHLASEPLSADIFNRFTGARVPGKRIHQGALGVWIMSFELPADLEVRDDYTLRVYTSTMSTWGEVDKLKVR